MLDCSGKKSSEHAEQAALFEWAAWNEAKYPELKLLYAIPNGGHRHITTAKRLKAEGVKAGVPDICLPVPSGRHSGLYIEMKYGKNKPSNKQNWWLEALKREGNKTAVCYSFEAARDEVLRYLRGEPNGI